MRCSLGWLCIFGGLLVVGMAEGSATAPRPSGPALDKATLAEVRKLQERRRDILREALEVNQKLYQTGHGTMGAIIEASKRLLAVELDLAATGAERIAAHETHLEKIRAFVQFAKASRMTARGTVADELDAQDACLEAEIGLLKAGGKLKKKEK